MENIEYARILAETADLMEIAAEDSFRIRSYRNAADTLQGYPERVDDVMEQRQGRVAHRRDGSVETVRRGETGHGEGAGGGH